MAKISVPLNNEQREQLKADFLTDIGERLKEKRSKRSLSLRKLAEGMPVKASALSKYENGTKDIPLSYLSLYSIYCDFELRELFPPDEMKSLFSSFRASVTVISDSQARRKEKDRTGKTLTARVYMQDGKEVREEVRTLTDTLRDMYKNAQIPADVYPFSDEEFCEYLMSFDNQTKESLCSAGDFLRQIMTEPRKETNKRAVADYIIDGTIINRVCQKDVDSTAMRAYAYYKRMMEDLSGDGFDSID